MTSNLSNVINYCRVINGSKGFNDTKTQLINEISQDYNTARQDTIYRFDVLINSIDAKDVYINDSTTSIKGVIDISRKQTADTDMEEKIQVYPNQIKQGDIIKFKVNDTDTLRTYLIKSKIDKKHGYDEGIFEECNHVLKWMYQGKLYEYPCILINNTKYTGGTKTQNIGITESSAMMGILITKNIDTKTIANNQRILLMDNAWRVTLNDNATMEGLLSISLGKDSISENDNTELEIADYYEHNYAITLSSNIQTLVETETYKITPMITDKGIQVSNANIVYTSSDETIAIIDSTGLVTSLGVGNCIITVSIGSVTTTLNLTVNAKTVTPVISYSCDWSTSKTSTGALLKTYVSSTATLNETIDGVSNSSLIVNYSLDSIGSSLLSVGSITIIRKSNTSFLVKNVSVNSSKSFTVTFVNSTDSSTISTQVVQLTGM